MGRYIQWDDVVARYRRAADIGDSEEIGDTYITYAEAELDARLSAYYAVPFSSNNVTAKDLAIDISFAKMQRFKDSEKAKQIDEHVGMMIDSLISGKSSMITTSGDMLASGVAGHAWSTTYQYTPIFGLGDIEDSEVDPDLVEAEKDARA